MKLFHNRALDVQVSLRPNAPVTQTDVPSSKLQPDEIATILMLHAEQGAKILAALYVGRKVLNTACEIAVIAAQKRL